MNRLSPSLRKAAVLVATLDASTADAILQHMSDDDAAKVRSALVELDDIPPDEQREVLAEFLRRQDSVVPPSCTDDDVALQLDPALEAAAGAAPAESSPLATQETSATEQSLAFLEHVEPSAIAALLAGEHPQTAAVVVAHLPPPQAAAVLERLPAALATETLERIAWLDEVTPEIRDELASGLKQQLAPHLGNSNSSPASLSHLTAVLEAMDFRHRQRVVLQLGQRNTPLVHRLGLFPSAVTAPPDRDHVVALRYRLDSENASGEAARQWTSATSPAPESWLTFDQLMHLDDAALRTVFAAADAELSLVALTGADPRFIARILRKLPAADAAVLRRRLEHPGPIRLRDIEQARTALAAVASRLAQEGTITLPAAARFAAAV